MSPMSKFVGAASCLVFLAVGVPRVASADCRSAGNACIAADKSADRKQAACLRSSGEAGIRICKDALNAAKQAMRACEEAARVCPR